MMVLAFLAGLVIVSLFFGGTPPQEQAKPAVEAAKTPILPGSLPGGQMTGLGGGFFVYHSPEDRFFLCRFENDRLQVVDVYTLNRREQTYRPGAPQASGHGWIFESLSREKEAVLEAKTKQFDKVANQKPVGKQDWGKLEELAREIAAVGGIEFLKGWLAAGGEWGGRRAAGLALGELGYVETVPTLTDMLLEGAEVREKAANLLVKLTGQDFFEGPKHLSQNKAVEAYKNWYAEYLKNNKKD